MKNYEPLHLPVVKVAYADVLTRPLFYPINDFANFLAKLMKKKTFTRNQIDLMKKEGCKVEVTTRVIELPSYCKE